MRRLLSGIGALALSLTFVGVTSTEPSSAHAQLEVQPPLVELAVQFITTSDGEFGSFLDDVGVDFRGLGIVRRSEAALYDPLKGDVTLAPDIAATADIDWTMSLVKNVGPNDVPFGFDAEGIVTIMPDGMFELGPANGVLPSSDTFATFEDFVDHFTSDIGVVPGGSGTGPNGEPIVTIASGLDEPTMTDAPILMIGARILQPTDPTACPGVFRDRGVFFRFAEGPFWDEESGLRLDLFNDFFAFGTGGIVNNCPNGKWLNPSLRTFEGPNVGFVDSVPNALTLIGPAGWISVIHGGDLGTIEGYRFFDFVDSEGEFAASADPSFETFHPAASILGVVKAPEPETPDTTTTTTTFLDTTTTAASAPETTAGAQAPPTTQPPSDDDDDGTSPLVWFLPLGIVVIVVGGYVIYTNRRDADEVLTAIKDCAKEEAAWRAAVQRYTEVCEDLQRALRELAESKRKLAEAKARATALETARKTSAGTGGVDYHHLPEGGTVTTEGLDAMIGTARRSVEMYENEVRLNQESVDRWKQHLKEATDAEASARAAYEACIGAKVDAPDPCPTELPDEAERQGAGEGAEQDSGGGTDEPESTPGGEPGGGTDEGEPTDGADEPEEPTEPETPGGTPPPVTPGDEDEPTPACDWAFYVTDGGGRRVLRPAARGHHECCVYDLKVVSTFSTNFTDGRIRQAADSATGSLPNERDRSLVGDGNPKGMAATFLAGVRTWPTGELGVMHGRGDMSEWPSVGATPGPWPELPERFPGEELIDALVDYTFDDETTVTVEFTDGCEGSVNQYEYNAEAGLELLTTVECTNENHDPVCPVELPTDGNASVSGTGDVDYNTGAALSTAGDDVDSPGETVGTGESHDHVFADKNTKLERPSTGDGGTKTQDDWESTHANHAGALAAVIVPPAVWPTTDRVSAAMSGSFEHKLDLRGSATPGHGPDGACAGHGVCKCAPKFRLLLERGRGTLWVDGDEYDVTRPEPDDPPLMGDTVDRWDVAGGPLPGPI